VTGDRASVSIVGGSGYVGGELVRLLLHHPHVTLRQVTSGSHAGHYLHALHPNLRSVTDKSFTDPTSLEPCDCLFLALPHGEAAGQIERFAALAQRVVDCSADFRLRDPAAYRRWYGSDHPAPSWLGKFVYGLPELHRKELGSARYASGVGCNAAVTMLALAPLAEGGMLRRVVADVKVGSSEGGAQPTAGSHHPERAGAVRSFMPTGHRHQAEIRQELGDRFDLAFSVTSVELVRGALVTAHCFLTQRVEERELWKLYRARYQSEPFVRLVRQKTGIHRFPEPKHLSGSNWCDVGFEVDPDSPEHRVVVVAAVDNLMKGAAGSAVQAMNLMMGWDETAGLTFPGLHPL
jgi:N-acetyl-gamma-glutamyl-phosphate/LysW-gamma-L-alpha-aminoadipyl-6-phosphate reductase